MKRCRRRQSPDHAPVTPPAPSPFTAHDVLERERIIRTREHAEQILVNRQLVQQAQVFVDAACENGNGSSGQLLWQDLLRLDLETILTKMMADNPEGQLLRSDSPFHIILRYTDDVERRRSWRRAKVELSTNQT